MNRITFNIDTDAHYTKDEQEDLLEAFMGWMSNMDGDVDVDSADIAIVDTSNIDNSAEEAKVREAVMELVTNGVITVNVEIADVDGEVIRTDKLSTEGE